MTTFPTKNDYRFQFAYEITEGGILIYQTRGIGMDINMIDVQDRGQAERFFLSKEEVYKFICFLMGVYNSPLAEDKLSPENLEAKK